MTVSVLDHVGPVDRSGLKVSDELEIMARNEAASLGADTIKPLAPPRDGAQSFGAYTCGALARNAARPPRNGQSPTNSNEAVETFPVKEH